MVEPARNQYLPDEVSPPGETLLETLEALGMTQAELAERMGRPKKTISEIINSKTAITPETALQLERALGIPAGFWNNRERQYREAIARQQENTRLEDWSGWLKMFPVREMIKHQWLPERNDAVERLRAVLGFFGVASPTQWEAVWHGRRAVAFRKSQSFKSDPGALAAWLCRGETLAHKLRTGAYDRGRFRDALTEARSLTRKEPEVFRSALVKLCADSGVAVVFVPELPKSRVSGATRWLSPSKALIQLSFRYRTDDHLWFTFFHEAGHILLHGKREIFLEGIDDQDGQELEADRFAADFLIPGRELSRFLSQKTSRKAQYLSKNRIEHFAHRIGVAPGIVVGRLQHDGLLPRTHCNALKRKLEWAD